MKNNKGFTLIELLVVIAIIGLLSTLAVVSLNSARAKSRDAKRVADVKQLQTALELHFNDKGAYPSENAVLTLGAGEGSTLSADAGWDDVPVGTKYMSKVPAGPSVGATAYPYTYGVSDGTTYCISFDLEAAMTSLGATTDCKAEPAGMSCAGNCS
ncbi:MAG: prepilin-type N-terminal cleavage/methylation domain-containing protein [bacterium]